MLNLLEYLERSAERVPEKTAFADGQRAFNYAELLTFAHRCGTAVARALEAVNRPIAVLAERTAVTVAAFQAVLASGNYYVPIDASMPRQRMESILSQLRPALLLYAPNQEETALKMSEYCPIMNVSEAEAEPADLPLLAGRRAQVLDIDPAYVIFTSGSTGAPKGIVIAHRSVIDFIEWMADACHFTADDVMMNQAPFYFDLSVKDLYLTLKCGATTYIPPKKCYLFPLLLLKEIEEKQATALVWATSAFHLVAASGALERCRPASLNKVILGGEALLARDLNIWRAALPEVQYTNLYGPTEVTVDCTWYPIPKDKTYADGEPIPIGLPCRNKQVLLLDEDLRPVPDGTPGEICVRGIGLARGYYGDWEKTGLAFVQNPANPDFPDRIYRTGDLGCRGTDGLLYFSARRDNQIKHMGYRIELGEVETALSRLSGLQEAVCFYDQAKSKIVCVYRGQMTSKEIASAIQEFLPRYMQPNIYRQLEAMPYNANGKIDRVKLKETYRRETDQQL